MDALLMVDLVMVPVVSCFELFVWFCNGTNRYQQNLETM